MIISPDNSTSNQVQQSMASTRSAGNQEQENLPSVSTFQFEQQIEERRKGEAEANGGLASGTLHYLDNQGSSGGNAGEAKYSAGAVSGRGKGQIEQNKWWH